MYHEQLVRVVVDNSRRDRAYCRYCGKPIVWRVTPQGRNIPLDADAVAVREDQNAETYVRYQLFDRDAVHMATCKKQPQRPANRRLVDAEARS